MHPHTRHKIANTVFLFFRIDRYHHITVMVYCWFTYEEYDPALKLFMGMNFFVHGIMYTYYALRVNIKRAKHNSFASELHTLDIPYVSPLCSWSVKLLLVFKMTGFSHAKRHVSYFTLLPWVFVYLGSRSQSSQRICNGHHYFTNRSNDCRSNDQCTLASSQK